MALPLIVMQVTCPVADEITICQPKDCRCPASNETNELWEELVGSYRCLPSPATRLNHGPALGKRIRSITVLRATVCARASNLQGSTLAVTAFSGTE
jgi:hypothetical protein